MDPNGISGVFHEHPKEKFLQILVYNLVVERLENLRCSIFAENGVHRK